MADGRYFRVLGPVSAEHAGTPIDLGGPQQRSVLALLVLHANTVVSVDQFVDLLWGDAPPASHRVALQGLISGLRRRLACGTGSASAIVTQQPGYRLDVSGDEVDLAEFRRDVGAARALRTDGDHAHAARLLRTALARWRGSAFADMTHPSVQHAAKALDELRVTTLGERIEADLAVGNDDLVAELTHLVADEPLRERFRGQLMTALARAGRPADALAVYRDARARIVEELGIEPSAALQELHRSILVGRFESRATTVRAMPGAVPRQLPADIPVFVGRRRLGRVATHLLLADPARRTPPCVAVTGPGGIGKTAFALHVAHQVRKAFPDGQLYVRLGGVVGHRLTPAVVLSRFLRALGVPPSAVPNQLDERSGLFRELLADRRVLVVLDDAADEAQLRPLLPAEPRCAVLVTSRRRLLGLETLRPIQIDVLAEADGIALLRAVVGGDRIDAEPQAAQDVVRHCGGLPLAIRIAGARLASRGNWTVADLAGRLAGNRGRLDWLQAGDLAVRASLAASCTGLGADQRALFRRLGLLASTEFPGWLPSALLGDGDTAAERVLEDLVDAHLVEPHERDAIGPRYRMHDLVHLVAGELATAEEEPDTRREALGRAMHGWYALAAAADDGLSHVLGLDPEPEPKWRPAEELFHAVRADPMGWFDMERRLLRSAVRQAADAGYAEVAWPLAQRMATYLDLRWGADELVEVCRCGLRAARDAADARGEASMLRLLVEAKANIDEYEDAMRHAEEAVAAYRALGDERGEAHILPRIAAFRRILTGALPQALVEHEAALAAARPIGDPLIVGFAAYSFAIALRYAGHHDMYPPLFEEARDAFRVSGSVLGEAWSLKAIALEHARAGRYDEGERQLQRARTILRAIGDSMSLAQTDGDLARLFAAAGRLDEATHLATRTLETVRMQRHRHSIGRILGTVGEIARARGDERESFAAHLEALAIFRELDMPAWIAQSLCALARLSEQIGDTDTAATYRAELAPLLEKLEITENDILQGPSPVLIKF